MGVAAPAADFVLRREPQLWLWGVLWKTDNSPTNATNEAMHDRPQ